MSSASAARRPESRARPTSLLDRPALRLVATSPLRLGRVPFAVLVAGILTAGLVTLLMLHTLAAQDAFRLAALQHRQAALADVEQRLTLAEQHDEAPARLAARARGLGMVPTGSIAFVEVRKHGKVVGVEQAAAPPPAPTPSAAPSTGPGSATSTSPGAHPAATPAGTAAAKQPATRPTAARHPHTGTRSSTGKPPHRRGTAAGRG